MKNEQVLALDLASTLGWACGSHLGCVNHGVKELPKTGEDIGTFLLHYRRWLRDALDAHDPVAIVFEMPILAKRTSLITVRKLCGLTGVTEMVAVERNIPRSEANLFDIRRHYIGRVSAPKSIPQTRRRKWMKTEMVAAVRAHGFAVADDNDADAIALLSYAISLTQPAGFILSHPDNMETPQHSIRGGHDGFRQGIVQDVSVPAQHSGRALRRSQRR